MSAVLEDVANMTIKLEKADKATVGEVYTLLLRVLIEMRSLQNQVKTLEDKNDYLIKAKSGIPTSTQRA